MSMNWQERQKPLGQLDNLREQTKELANQQSELIKLIGLQLEELNKTHAAARTLNGNQVKMLDEQTKHFAKVEKDYAALQNGLLTAQREHRDAVEKMLREWQPPTYSRKERVQMCLLAGLSGALVGFLVVGLSKLF